MVVIEILDLKDISIGIDYGVIFLEEIDYDNKGNQFEYYQNECKEFFSEDDSHMIKCKLHINTKYKQPVFIEVDELWDEEDIIHISEEEKKQLAKEMIKHINYI